MFQTARLMLFWEEKVFVVGIMRRKNVHYQTEESVCVIARGIDIYPWNLSR